MDIKSTKPASILDAKEILAEREKEGELGYEQSQALSHADRFSKGIKQDIVNKLKKNKNISEELAVKIADIQPTTPEALKAILLKDRVELSEDEIKEIIVEFS